ncbi:MAG: DegT/DnrJ/EryC1/StrS family aminotransferase [Actinobacteria bacterium]|nr:DegT/DnrJ/EryC1/StrS family aminotransferase [Actinomycetota bacterium]
MKNIPIAKPYIDKSDIDLVVKVLKSGYLSLGPRHIEFEKMFSSIIDSKYAISVANGTCGLHLAVKAIGIKEGDEVITTPFSFVSSANCLLYEKAKPVFVDIDETTYNLNADSIEKAITKKTKAILVVHIFGQSADMEKIMKIAKAYKLKVIEDACESLGSFYNKKKTGTFGDVGVFAFYPNKQMTTAEGGMMVTNDQKIYMLCKSLRNQGREDNNKWLQHKYLGYNYRLSELHSALGITQLKKINFLLSERIKIAGYYNKYLQGNKNIILPEIGVNRNHTWFLYVVRIMNNNRNSAISKLEHVGIQTRAYLPSIHLQPFIKKMFGYKKGDFPVSEEISSQTLALPLYIGLKENDVEYISKKLKKAINDEV